MTDSKQLDPSSGSPLGGSAKPSNFNLPNVLTTIRILFIPVLAVLILRSDGKDTALLWWSFGVFLALMATDKLDGDIARKRGLVTDFGKIADPIADKALMIVTFVCLNIVGVLPWWITVVIVIRELGITLWRMVQLRKGHVIPASRGGKIKTALQTFAVGLYLLPLPSWLETPRYVIMLAAVVVTVWTGLDYLRNSWKVRS